MYNQETQTALFRAIINMTAEAKDVLADSRNPHFNSKYASLSAHLEALKPLFRKHGLAVIQMPATRDGMIGVDTIIVHENGASFSNFCGIPATDKMNGQHAGAIISYLRRYSLASVAGVGTDDDDAEIDRVARSSQPAAKAASPAAAKPAARAAALEGSGDARATLIEFGKHKGKTLGEVFDSDPSWVEWAMNRELKLAPDGKPYRKDVAFRDACSRLITAFKGEAGQADEPEVDEVPF